jgi:hypothetical protein
MLPFGLPGEESREELKGRFAGIGRDLLVGQMVGAGGTGAADCLPVCANWMRRDAW